MIIAGNCFVYKLTFYWHYFFCFKVFLFLFSIFSLALNERRPNNAVVISLICFKRSALQCRLLKNSVQAIN